jgi:CDP-glucose 4,6-dehydratase
LAGRPLAVWAGAVEGMVTVDDSWHGRPVFVTGATGIVGSWLVKDLLARSARVVALVRDPDPQSELYRSEDYRSTSIIHGRLEDYWTLERAINEQQIHTVFHLAAQSIVGVAQRHPLQTFEANIRGTYNLLDVCRLHQGLVKRVIIASSDKAYGEQAVLPYTEDMPLQGRGPYDVSKTCTDLLAQSYYQTYGLPVAIARCGNVYGGGDLNWSRIVPETIQACLRGVRPVIRSDGSYVRDYIYVQDVSSAYLRLAECVHDPRVQGEAFNFSPEHAVSVLDLVGRIQRLMGCEHLTPDVQNTAEGEIRSQYLDASKARRLLGWRPRFNLDEGLAETIAWYHNYLRPEADGEYTPAQTKSGE